MRTWVSGLWRAKLTRQSKPSDQTAQGFSLAAEQEDQLAER